jgi:hypothetical protein
MIFLDQKQKKLLLERKKKRIEKKLKIGELYLATPIDDFNRLRHLETQTFIYIGVEIDWTLEPIHSLPGMLKVFGGSPDKDFWLDETATVLVSNLFTGKKIFEV